MPFNPVLFFVETNFKCGCIWPMEMRLGLFLNYYFFLFSIIPLFLFFFPYKLKLLFGMEDTAFYNDDVFQTMTITPRAFPQMDLLDVRVKKQE